MKFPLKHVLSAREIEPKALEIIFSLADRLEKAKSQPLKGKILASLFYEPSTRTRFSFESAMLRLGGSVIATENAGEFSSAAKGETLEDSIKVVNHYADVIVIRHPEAGTAERASKVSSIPIINAGDGAGEHPTQALLDLYTIRRELGAISGLKVALCGDLKHGRTARSLARLLSKFRGVEIFFVSPGELKMGDDVKEELKKTGIAFTETKNLEDVISKCDVLYQTRIQRERFASEKEYQKLKGSYKVTLKTAQAMKKGSIIMHPLPRVDEISPEVDASSKAVYFKQAGYGLLVRMALLTLLLKK